MGYLASTSPDITEGVPFTTSLRAKGVAASDAGDYDIHIGSVGFRLAATDQTPYRRSTAQVRREQLDTFANVGEQSLDSGWWRRSQRSWHMGAGLLYLDSFSGDDAEMRFRDNLGIDPWTPGQISLLPAMTLWKTAAGTVRSAAAGDDIYFSDGTALKLVWPDGTLWNLAYNGADPASTIIDLAVSGRRAYVLNANGIYTQLEDETWHKFSDVGADPSVIEIAKYRLIFADGPNLYELALNNETAPVSTTLPTAFYSHPSAGWTWTAVADTPGPILAAGYSGDTSAIFAFPLDTSGATPTVGAGSIVAQLPYGEVVRGLSVHLGQYVGISTDRGFRVGVLSGDTLTWGPLTVEGECWGVGAHENSFYVAADFSTVKVGPVEQGSADNGVWQQWGLIRVDVSREREGGLFAWAFDRQTGSATGVIRDVPRPSAFGADAEGVFIDNGYESSGFIRTGQIRFDMVEPKAFRRVSVDANITTGEAVTVSSVIGSSTSSLFSLGPDNNSRADRNLGIEQPIAMMGLQITFTGDGSTSPTVYGYQIKALPAGPRSRIVRLPLLCKDFERNRNDVRYGHEGRAREIVLALEEIESGGEVIVVTEHAPTESYEAYIEGIEYVRNNSPTRGRDDGGGILEVAVRKL